VRWDVVDQAAEFKRQGNDAPIILWPRRVKEIDCGVTGDGGFDTRRCDAGDRIDQGTQKRIARKGCGFAPDNRMLASACSGGSLEVKLWDAVARTPVVAFTGHQSGVNCVAFSRMENGWQPEAMTRRLKSGKFPRWWHRAQAPKKREEAKKDDSK
jgi:WD40 repeat protein